MTKPLQTELLLDAVGRVIGRMRQEARAELHTELNVLRTKLSMPVILVKGMAEKPRIRVPHRFGIRL